MSILSLIGGSGSIPSFLNDQGGIWAFVALPLAAIAAAAAVVQVVPWLKATMRDEARNIALLRNQIRHFRIDLDLDARLVLGTLLPVRLQRRDSSEPMSAAELYESVRDGSQAFVVGSAGAGKSILALTLVKESLRRSELDLEQPLMEVIPLRRWQRPKLRPTDADSLLRFVADCLHDEYPMFGKRFFTELLRSQRLIPCLDGLDEVEKDRREPLLRSLRSYMATGMPVVVLSRESDVPSLQRSGTEEPIRRFEVHEVLPLAPAAVAEVTEEAQLAGLLDEAPQPHRLTRLFGNPLILTIVARVRRAGALRLVDSTDDPSDELWEAFFDSGLGEGGGSKNSLRARAGTTALLAHQRKQDVFRVDDLYGARAGIWWTLAVVALPAAAYAWMERKGGIALYIVFILGLSLVPRSDLWFAKAAYRIFPRRSGWRGALFVLLLAVAVIGCLIGGGLAESSFRRILLEGMPAGSWWREYGQTHITLHWWFPVLLLTGGCVWAAAVDPVSRHSWGLLFPGRTAGIGVLLAGFALVAAGLLMPDVSALFFGLLLLTPWLMIRLSRLALTTAGHIPGSGLEATCEAMAQAGILHEHRSKFRFRHAEMSWRLAQEAACRLSEASELDVLLDRKRPYLLLDARVRQAETARLDPFVTELSRRNRGSEDVLTASTLYWYYGRLEPTVTMPWLQGHVRRYPDSAMGAHVAEVLDAKGRPEEATRFWLRAVSSNQWLLHKWIRRQITKGHVRAAMEELEGRVKEQAPHLVSLERLMLAESRCRFGSGPERAAGLEDLRRICKVAEPYLSRRAMLEFARVRAEDLDSVERAEEMLSSTLDEGILDSLKYARSAQLCLAGERREEAQQFGREAYALIHWTDDPTHQLEVFVTAAYTTPELQEAALARVRALAGYGWCLRGRSAHWLDPGTKAGRELLALAYR